MAQPSSSRASGIGAELREVGAGLSALELVRQNFDDQRQEWRRLFAEVLGTFLLVLVGAGAGVVDAVSHGAVGRGASVTAPGLMVMAIILFMGAVSGAHLNPAVAMLMDDPHGRVVQRDPWDRVQVAEPGPAVGAGGRRLHRSGRSVVKPDQWRVDEPGPVVRSRPGAGELRPLLGLRGRPGAGRADRGGFAFVLRGRAEIGGAAAAQGAIGPLVVGPDPGAPGRPPSP